MITHKIKNGFDLRLKGPAEHKLVDAPEPVVVAVQAVDFPGIKPKLKVKEGDPVKTGQPLFFDKQDPDRQFVSPVTGTVSKVVFGERRRLLGMEIAPASADDFFDGPQLALDALATTPREEIVAALKQSGLWSLIRQRPVGKTPKGDVAPVAIFVNGMDTEPLAADPAFAVKGHGEDLQAGVDLLRALSEGAVYLTVSPGEQPAEFQGLHGVEMHSFAGKHPAGLVGTHLQEIRPLGTHDTAWYLKAQEAVLLGQWLRSGNYPTHRVVAAVGEAMPKPCYYRVREGASLTAITGGKPLDESIRVISGTVLNGYAVGGMGYLGYHAWTVTAIPDGEGVRDLFGWALPQPGKLTASRAVFPLVGGKDYSVDARMNGGPRAIVNIGQWDSMTPLDIHPSYLIRAIQANDLEEAVSLGLLDVTEEDLALCTVVDPSKMDLGEIVRKGLDLYEAEG